MLEKRYIAAALAVAVLFAGAGYKLYLQKQQEQVFTGTVEVTKADVTPKVSGYLARLLVKEGDSVTRGALVGEIETEDYAVQLQRDKAALAAAEALLTDLRRGARPQELEEAAASRDAALAVLYKADKDLERTGTLHGQGAVSAQALDEAVKAREVAYKQLQAADAALRLLESGSREDQIAAQEQEVRRCRAVARLSELNAQYTQLGSPVDGVVLKKNYESGEFVAAGTAVLTVGDLSDSWVKIYLPSAMLGRLQYGQECRVSTDAYPERQFTGRVKEISDSAEYTPRQSITTRERANMVFAVKVQLDNEERIFKPGMIADVVL